MNIPRFVIEPALTHIGPFKVKTVVGRPYERCDPWFKWYKDKNLRWDAEHSNCPYIRAVEIFQTWGTFPEDIEKKQAQEIEREILHDLTLNPKYADPEKYEMIYYIELYEVGVVLNLKSGLVLCDKSTGLPVYDKNLSVKPEGIAPS